MLLWNFPRLFSTYIRVSNNTTSMSLRFVFKPFTLRIRTVKRSSIEIFLSENFDRFWISYRIVRLSSSSEGVRFQAARSVAVHDSSCPCRLVHSLMSSCRLRRRRPCFLRPSSTTPVSTATSREEVSCRAMCQSLLIATSTTSCFGSGKSFQIASVVRCAVHGTRRPRRAHLFFSRFWLCPQNSG